MILNFIKCIFNELFQFIWVHRLVRVWTLLLHWSSSVSELDAGQASVGASSAMQMWTMQHHFIKGRGVGMCRVRDVANYIFIESKFLKWEPLDLWPCRLMWTSLYCLNCIFVKLPQQAFYCSKKKLRSPKQIFYYFNYLITAPGFVNYYQGD